MMLDQKAHITICNNLGLTGYSSIDMTRWKTKLADRWDALTESVSIAVIGKYTNLSDAYLSVIKALQHACLALRKKCDIRWVEAAELEPEVRWGAGPCEPGRRRIASLVQQLQCHAAPALIFCP